MGSGAREGNLDPPAAHGLEDAYAVLVSTTGGRWRRRLFLSLSAAERAADSARDRGHAAELILVRLRVPGGGQ